MISNPLLEENYRVQKLLTEEAQYDVEQYTKNTHQIAKELENKYGMKFVYGINSMEGAEVIGR